MTDSPHVSAEELLEHTQWLRSLARRLIGDGPEAEDVVQQTFLQALRSPPGPGGLWLPPPMAIAHQLVRAWLEGVSP